MALLRRSRSALDDVFPGFTDVVEIGIGSLATVYRARELGTNRPVALKLLNVRDASPRALESFERESLALGAVSAHPNIVTLYRSFQAGDGRPVLVLELCSGSIAERLRDGRGLPVPEVLAVGIKIAGALETAHRAGILHRDVKPQNILITEFGEPALADFGVAMLQSATQTTAGLFDFTTLHAAPELLEGGETSAATDVYELASTLYQLVAGRSAFRAYEGESPASVILRILRDPVQPLVDAHVPQQLSDLLIHAMSKDKDSRPHTAAEFAAALGVIEVEQDWPRTYEPVLRRTPALRLAQPPVEVQPEPPLSRPEPPHPEPPHPEPEPPLPPQPEPPLPPHPEPPLPHPEPPLPPHPEPPLPRPEPPRPEPEPEPHLFDWRPLRQSDDDAVPPAAETHPATPAEDALEPAAALWPADPDVHYPVPPPALSSDQTLPAARPWTTRAADHQAVTGDLTLDPTSLRGRVVLRSGTSSLAVDETGLIVRRGLRRTDIPWTQITGFETRTGDSAAGHVVALTATGPIPLAATRRSAGDLRYVVALLNAFRQRARSVADH